MTIQQASARDLVSGLAGGFRLVAASSNAHKISEISQILGRPIAPARAFAADFAPVENGETFEANALIKARALADLMEQNLNSAAGEKFLIIADDSGLCVDALAGAPGIFSARFAAVFNAQNCAQPPGDQMAVTDKISFADCAQPPGGEMAVTSKKSSAKENAAGAQNCSDEQNRRALTVALLQAGCFASEGEFVCAIALSDGFCLRAACRGIIAPAARGSGGFGYDAMFFPLELNAPDACELALSRANASEFAARFAAATPAQQGEILREFCERAAALLPAQLLSFAQVSAQSKNAVSHRAKALCGLKNYLDENYPG